MPVVGTKKETLEKEFVVENNTLKKVVKIDVREKIELEIGDSKQLEAYPQAKIMKWNNEVNFSIRRDNGSRSFREQNGMIVFEGTEEDVRFYELVGFEDGGLEVEILLKNKPKSNSFDFSIETKGLDFFYQPELTIEEKDRGASRPDNVVGSYAVYHKTKRNNNLKTKHDYKTGKAFHIYRPKAIDAEGVESWCELNISGNRLSVTVPQSFLDKAVYPVIVDPTFGYETAGVSEFQNSNAIIGSIFELIDSANITQISAYYGVRGYTGPIITGIYNADETFADITSSEITSPGDNTNHWLDFSVTTTEVLSPGDYYIVSRSAVGGSGQPMFQATLKYDTGSTNQGGTRYNITYSSTFPDPVDFTEYQDAKFSIYATYEESSVQTQVKFPGTVVSDSTIGDVEWSNTDNVKTDDSDFSTAFGMFSGTKTEYLKCSNLGFNIPNNSTILGIKAEIKKWEGSSGRDIVDNEIKIVKSDGIIGTQNKADATTKWRSLDNTSYVVYGGVDDTWGETWAASDINNSNFGLVVSAIGQGGVVSGNARVYNVQLTVYYEESVTGATIGIKLSGTFTDKPLMIKKSGTFTQASNIQGGGWT